MDKRIFEITIRDKKTSHTIKQEILAGNFKDFVIELGTVLDRNITQTNYNKLIKE